jgi:tellurite methyltransferase
LKRDRDRWDARHAAHRDSIPQPDAFLIEHADLLSGGRALDLACGTGSSSIFLAEHGYVVEAIDISAVAISKLQREAQARRLPIHPFVADLDAFPLPVDRYDLVVVFAFFSPTLMPAIAGALRHGGLLIYATYNHRHTSIKPGFNRDYLVPRGGLTPYFPELSILVDEPEAGESGNISRLIAVRQVDIA